ncbi:MAG: ABC transporter substrate-binding protein [Acidimicrobiia bacterium]|nr:ABC transporter substrate-binding protein [Acidimicrobiia bacterium]
MTRHNRWSAALVALATCGAAACGSGDDGPGASGPATTEPPATSAAQAPTTTAAATTASTPVPQSMPEWESLWEAERAAMVEKIEANGWGRSPDGKTLVGPAGFSIDLGQCPQGWDDTEGLTDTEIRIGYVLPQSGILAESAAGGQAGDALYRYYADQGAFSDVNGKTRQVDVIMRDDAYDPARTIPLVDELIDSEKVFLIETVGSAPTLKTYDKLSERCIPQPLPASGHPGMGDPVNHPWTTSSSISYSTEAVLWGAFIEQRLDEFGGKVKVASLKINNDFGAAYDSGFEAFLASSDHKDDIEYVSETSEATAPTIKELMTSIAAEDPDMFIAMTVGTQCGQAITEAAENGMKDATEYKFLSSACKASGPVTEDKVGEASDGWWSVGGGLKDIESPASDDDPFIVAARQFVTDAGYDYHSPSMNLGLYYNWTIAQAMMIAGQLDGGLSRSNLILVLRSMDMTNPMLLPGLDFNMNGNEDAFLLEGSDIAVWDAETQAWVLDSITDISGRTPLCAWDQATSRCE